MFFGQVDQVKVDGEGPGDLLGARQAPGRDQLRDLVRLSFSPPVSPVLFSAGRDHRAPQPFHVGEQIRPGRVADDVAEDAGEHPDIVPHRLGQRGAIASLALSVSLFTVRA